VENDLHFNVNSLLVKGALEWKMVSKTSAERPDSMSQAPSEARLIVSTTPVESEISCPCLRQQVPPEQNPEETLSPRTKHIIFIF